MKQSPSGELSKQDWKQWGKNTLIFSAPLLILFLTQIQAGVDLKTASSLVLAALINALIDLLRKYQAGK